MAREIIIRNVAKKAPLTITDIIGNDNYSYGVFDEHYRIYMDKISEDSLLVFDNDNIGRGVQIIGVGSNKKLHLALSLPTTENDIRMLYKLAARIASLWKANHIFVEADKVDIEDIEIYVQHDIDMNIKLLRDAENIFTSEYIDFPCATNPISFTASQLCNYASDMRNFETFLHKKQSIGAYFSAPLFYEVNDVLNVLYVVFDEGHIILPDTPQMTFRSKGNETVCDNAFIACPNLLPNEKLSRISFGDFMERVPAEKKSRFDCRHTLVEPMSIEELQEIFKLSK